jgi:hypothetical protein
MRRIIVIATAMVVFCSGIAAFASSEIQNGDRVYIRSKVHHYLNADNGKGNVKMTEQKSTASTSDEQWWIEKAD